MCNALYNSLYSNAVLKLDNSDGVLEERYLEREDMYSVLNSVKFDQVNELKGKVDRLNIITSYGVKMTIVEPQKGLDLKVNMAFSALRTLIERGKGEETSGTIAVRYSYDKNNKVVPVCEYHID